MKIPKIIATLLIAVLFVGVLPAFAGYPTEPHSADSMWVEPSTLIFDTGTTDVGHKFNVTLWTNITDAPTGIGGWQFKLIYNTDYLKAAGAGRVWYTNFTVGRSQFFEDISTISVLPAFGSYNGTGTGDEWDYVQHGESWLEGPVRGPGYGSLSIVEFEIIAPPPKGEIIESLLSLSETWAVEYTYVIDWDTLADLLDAVYGALYKYTWSAPAKPSLAIDPTLREYGPYPPNATSTTFTEDVYITDLSAAWYLVNASFKVNYNSSFLEVTACTLNATNWDITTTCDYTTTEGIVDIFVETSQFDPPLSGDVHVGTITFNITHQAAYPTHYESDLTFSDVLLKDHTMIVETKTPYTEGKIVVKGLLTLPLPWLEVVFPDTGTNEITLGPEPVVGKEFEAEIWIKNLHFAWYLVGLEYRLSYNDTLLEVVDVEEGPYLPSFNQTPTPPYTWFSAYIETDGIYGPHVLVGELILPNATGQWPAPLAGADPPEDGHIATITYKVVKQLPIENYSCTLEFIALTLIDIEGVDIPYDLPVDGTVTIIGTYYGALRQIDVFGGANNAGYGASVFPAPYGGQGLNNPMDLVIPQSEVYLYSLVTYRYWPVQSKEVSFEIIDNHGVTWAKRVAITDSSGIASITFRMPWVCGNPQYYLGEWTVVTTANLADIVISDTLTFHYDYMVHMWKVTTDEFYYAHEDYIGVTVEYGTHAIQYYPALFTVTVTDELGVPIGINATYSVDVGGAEYCTYLNGSFTVTIYIPKFAFAGYAYIHVCCFDKEPAEGGFAWCPEAEPAEIYILPEWQR